MICEWSSSRFPQNSFSLISFIIPFYSLFHPPLTPISRPSPSSPLIPAIHSYYHPCSLCIHSHLSLLLNHFHQSHSYPFPLQSSHSIPFHHFHSFAIPLLTPDYHAFSGTLLFITDTLSSHSFLFSFLYLPFYTSHSSLFFASHYRVSTMRSVSCLFGYSYRMFIYCVDKKHSQSIRRNCFCL